MSFDTIIDTEGELTPNLVVKFETDTPFYISKHQVDSGLTIDADKIGLVDSFTVNPVQVDLLRSTQTINKTQIKIHRSYD